ncbi:MAG: hypothetical protein ACOYB0_08140 [Polynucleobacter sp.]
MSKPISDTRGPLRITVVDFVPLPDDVPTKGGNVADPATSIEALGAPEVFDSLVAVPATVVAETARQETHAAPCVARNMPDLRRHYSGQASRVFWLRRATNSVPAALVRSSIAASNAALVRHAEQLTDALTEGLSDRVRLHIAALVADQLLPRLESELQTALETAPHDASGDTGSAYTGMVAGEKPGATTAIADHAKKRLGDETRDARERRA